MSDLLVRDLSKEAITRIDSFAKAKGVSRNEFLKEHLESLSHSDEMRKFEANYRITMEKILRVLDLNTKVMKVFLKNNCLSIEEVLEDENFL